MPKYFFACYAQEDVVLSPSLHPQIPFQKELFYSGCIMHTGNYWLYSFLSCACGCLSWGWMGTSQAWRQQPSLACLFPEGQPGIIPTSAVPTTKTLAVGAICRNTLTIIVGEVRKHILPQVRICNGHRLWHLRPQKTFFAYARNKMSSMSKPDHAQMSPVWLYYVTRRLLWVPTKVYCTWDSSDTVIQSHGHWGHHWDPRLYTFFPTECRINCKLGHVQLLRFKK